MSNRNDPSRKISAPRGTELSCRSWLTEAPYRMIQNNLDAVVAENPAELVVYGGIGRAARDWDRSEEQPSELQSLMRNSYAVFCLKNTKTNTPTEDHNNL